jgi:CRP-like cAMP-binding protein
MSVEVEPLRTLTVFAGLSDGQLERVAAVLKRHAIPAGMEIVTEGERSTSLFVLSRGAVGTSKRLGLAVRGPMDATKQKFLLHIAAPQFFGEIGLLTDHERSATITAQTECEVLELRRADFDRLAQDDLALGYHVVRNIAVVLADRLRNTDHDVLKLTAALSLSLGNR